MTDQPTDQLEPLKIGELLREFADFTIAELVLEIKEGKEALETEKKSLAASVFARAKAEQELEDLRERINTSLDVLNGEAEISVVDNED